MCGHKNKFLFVREEGDGAFLRTARTPFPEPLVTSRDDPLTFLNSPAPRDAGPEWRS